MPKRADDNFKKKELSFKKRYACNGWLNERLSEQVSGRDARTRLSYIEIAEQWKARVRELRCLNVCEFSSK